MNPRRVARVLVLLSLTGAITCVSAAAPDVEEFLPPLVPWHGASEKVLEDVPSDWRTPAEASEFRTTPSYAATIDFLKRLDRASSLISVREIGRTAQGRPLGLVIATRDPRHDFDSLRRSPRARVLVQAGIHAGEIDGKDAGLLLLRDIVTGRRADVLDRSTLLFVPVYSPDGHERIDAHGRVNQRGPENAGWRTTARNLNLNRDYTRLDAPESRALVKLLGDADPDLYIDLHVTDGHDQQYDVTYLFNVHAPWSPASAQWLAESFTPPVVAGLKAAGHVPGVFYDFKDATLPSAGLLEGRGTARYSTGYGDLRHLPTVLIENHSLKPYRRRVLGTYVLIEQALRAAGGNVDSLRKAIATDRARRMDPLPVRFTTGDKPARTEEFLGIEWESYDSPISGKRQVRYLGRPLTQKLPVYTDHATLSVARPVAYWIPPQWSEIGTRLRQHGIRVDRIDAPVRKSLRYYRLRGAQLGAAPNEGRAMVSLEGVASEVKEEVWPAGSLRVSTDQPLGDLAMVMLEPQSEDSLFAWGYLLEPLQRTEYIEGYVLEPMARKMLADDPALAAAWKEALRDPQFAADPIRRLTWFYERAGLSDERYLLYPIARE
jgi:hypothetical protein